MTAPTPNAPAGAVEPKGDADFLQTLAAEIDAGEYTLHWRRDCDRLRAIAAALLAARREVERAKPLAALTEEHVDALRWAAEEKGAPLPYSVQQREYLVRLNRETLAAVRAALAATPEEKC